MTRLVWTALAVTLASQSPRNLLVNPGAADETQGWRAARDAVVESCGSSLCFVVRNGAEFQQTVELPEGSAGQFVALLGAAASERVNADGDITDMAYLYALVLDEDGRRITAHLQGQGLNTRPEKPNTWIKLWGVFRVPEGSARLSFQLKQGLRRGSSHNASAARFDDLGLSVFKTDREAEEFVRNWRSPRLEARQ
jgi:hypothetical protein